MPAEPAAATGDTAETQSNGATSTPEASQNGQDAPHAEPIGSRLGEILNLMELPEDVRGTVQPRENTDEHQETTDNADASEGDPGTGREEGPERDREREENDQPQAQQPVAAEADELSDEQRTTWPAEALGRIHKTTAQREKFKQEATTERQAREVAERERDELKQKLQTLPAAPQLAPTQDDPLADVQTGEQLAQATSDYEALHEWTTLNPNGATDVPTGQTDAEGKPILRDFSAEEVARRRVFAERALRRIPEKQNYIQNRQQFDAVAREIYADVFNPATEEGKIAQQLHKALPEIYRFTDGALWLARAVRGFRAEIAEQEAKRNGKTVVQQHGRTVPGSKVEKFLRPQPPLAPSVPTVRGTRVAPAPREQDVNTAMDRFTTRGGDDEALEDLVSTLRNAQKPAGNGSRAPAMA